MPSAVPRLRSRPTTFSPGRIDQGKRSPRGHYAAATIRCVRRTSTNTATRRGNHQVMMRGNLPPNIRHQDTRWVPRAVRRPASTRFTIRRSQRMPMYDAAMEGTSSEGVPLVVVSPTKEYGTGSSARLGRPRASARSAGHPRAVITQVVPNGIHRLNLIGMGVVHLLFEGRHVLGRRSGLVGKRDGHHIRGAATGDLKAAPSG